MYFLLFLTKSVGVNENWEVRSTRGGGVTPNPQPPDKSSTEYNGYTTLKIMWTLRSLVQVPSGCQYSMIIINSPAS